LRIDIDAADSLVRISKRNGGSVIGLKFDHRTLQNWYPYNNAYTYMLNSDGEIQLFKEASMKYTPNELGGTHYLNTFMWYNKCIREDNKRIAEFGHKMGVCSPFLPYGVADVNRGLAIVGATIDRMSKKYTLEYVEQTGKKYNQNADSEALKNLPDQAAMLYARVGEVYSMLNTMRKVATIHGFGRPVEPPVWDTNSSR